MIIVLWRERWLSYINELTSLDLQRDAWLDEKNTNPHWSFEEFMRSYFDDLSIDDNYKYQLDNGYITKQEFKIIEDWHQALNKYNPPKDDVNHDLAVLSDSTWLEILKTGISAKVKLAKILNADEAQFLTKKIDYLKFI